MNRRAIVTQRQITLAKVSMRLTSKMKELVDALADNGYANGSAKLSSIVADTMQDGQYSMAARDNALVLARYEAEYGPRTVAEIRALYAIQQMEQCLAADDPDVAIGVMSLLARARDALPLNSPLREDLRVACDKAMVQWH
jgi:hypothetical protein